MTTLQLKAAGASLLVLLLLAAWKHHENDTLERGAQQVRDSIAVEREKGYLAAIAKADKDASDANARAVQIAAEIGHEGERITQRIAQAPVVPSVAPPIPAANGQDSIRLAGDDSAYLVPHPIAIWMMAADGKLKFQDSLLAQASELITKRVPLMRQAYDSTILVLRVANANLDSLVKLERARADNLQKKESGGFLSKVTMGLKVAGLATAGYFVGKATR